MLTSGPTSGSTSSLWGWGTRAQHVNGRGISEPSGTVRSHLHSVKAWGAWEEVGIMGIRNDVKTDSICHNLASWWSWGKKGSGVIYPGNIPKCIWKCVFHNTWRITDCLKLLFLFQARWHEKFTEKFWSIIREIKQYPGFLGAGEKNSPESWCLLRNWLIYPCKDNLSGNWPWGNTMTHLFSGLRTRQTPAPSCIKLGF